VRSIRLAAEPVEVDLVAEPCVERRITYGWPPSTKQAEVADEPFVEDRIDRAAVMNAAVGLPPHAGAV
jgi:hypothetical protein